MVNKSILLVEDNPDDIELTLHAFKKNHMPYPVVIANDGVEAVKQLFEEGEFGPGHTLPSLVLLDLKLPKIDGLEVLCRIRSNERTRSLPVVILTSSRDQSDLESGYKLGANSYIVKPLDFTRFLDMTRLLEQYWLNTNEPPPSACL
jgi:two-component system response regulator